MAIDVYLQNIHGKKKDEVFDINYSLAKVWPVSDPSFPLLQYIDPYGNVIFNGSQMGEVQKELGVLIEQSSSEEQRDVLCGESVIWLRSVQTALIVFCDLEGTELDVNGQCTKRYIATNAS
jgi:hypothetical protein